MLHRFQQPHRCRCGALTDALGHYSLSCQRNLGRLPRHAALNDVVYRALAAAGIVATLEPRGLDRGDGRRPDGITVFPFRRGRMLIGSRHRTSQAPSLRGPSRRYDFSLLAMETSGVLGLDFSDLLDDIGSRITQRRESLERLLGCGNGSAFP
ncbi:hypothetical protein E2C01_099675 [Portunus trituberculatus]|uniref:Uncharacterized protein n=1 Tax=Portunus trituberculatus TaxID=210409 RepID=A0A5B7KFI9_PORTR|nr:hypothetical protein [Portunus trituberculatus]